METITPQEIDNVIHCADRFPGLGDKKNPEQLASAKEAEVSVDDRAVQGEGETSPDQPIKAAQEKKMSDLYQEFVMPYLISNKSLNRKNITFAKRIAECLEIKTKLGSELNHQESALLAEAEAITSHINPSLIKNKTREAIKESSL
jgi:hypothetical protein